MIAVCGGLMRTGSIAMWQIMREIIVSTESGRALKLGSYSLKDTNKWAEKDKWILVRTHEYDSFLEEPIKNGKCKVVVTIRDQRDVVVSLMNFNNYGFDTAIHAKAFRRNVVNYYEWLDKVPEDDLLVVRYEDFVGDRTNCVLSVADFFGIDLDRPTAEKIDRKWNIQANQKRARDKHPYDSHNYMAERHINSGEVDQWVEALTDEQTDYIEGDPEVGGWLHDVGYAVRCNICYAYNDADKIERYDDVFTCDSCKWDVLETEAYGEIIEEE